MVWLYCQFKDEAGFEMHEVVMLQGAGHVEMQEMLYILLQRLCSIMYCPMFVKHCWHLLLLL